jgi:hypothetical protein
MESLTVLSHPWSLILLIHLHILEFPQAETSDNGYNIFDPSRRGLRDRTKSMEDICYFLVGKIEGGKDRAKLVSRRFSASESIHAGVQGHLGL